MPTKRDTNNYRDQPLYWFTIYETAMDKGNYQLAATAQRELRRLGIVVRHVRTERSEDGDE